MLLGVVSVILFCFAFVLLFGAPYLPTLKKQRLQALKILQLRSGQTLLELGCGDGRLLNTAAQLGIKSVGYELNPMLVIIAKIVTFRNRKLVKVKWANFWETDWPDCDGIYVFLIDRFMAKLDIYVQKQSRGPVKLLSYGFQIPGKKVFKKQAGFYLYKY